MALFGRVAGAKGEAGAWPTTRRRKGLLKAALTLALGFDTWRLLVREQGLTDDQAIESMMRLTRDGRGAE